jgi:hypothetical protein
VFQGRSGAHARALFETKDQAAQFAERHARIVAPDGTPLKWEDASDSSVSTTTLGDYLVAPIPQD